MDIKSYTVENDGSFNFILGMSHFIKTVDDLAEIINTTVPGAKYGLAFCEASSPALIRFEGSEKSLTDKAIDIMNSLKAGHSFCIILKDCFPINIMAKLKMCDEVVNIYCATANPLTVLTVENESGAGIIGVIDGVSPKGVENEKDKYLRREFLKKIKYKFGN